MEIDKKIAAVINSLPNKILVSIHQGKSGAWIADLPKYDIFKEADSQIELDYFINDLIFSYFEVPDMVRKMIKYTPYPEEVEQESRGKEPSWEDIAFLKYISPNANFCSK
jgi:hypothetical protein